MAIKSDPGLVAWARVFPWAGLVWAGRVLI